MVNAHEVREFAVNTPTLEGLVAQLQDLMNHGVPGDTQILVWDADGGEYYPLSLAIYENDGNGAVQLFLSSCEE